MTERIKSDSGKQSHKKQPSKAAKRKKNLKNEKSMRHILDNMKHTNILIMGIPEREENEQGIKNLSEEMTENFPNFVKEKDTQVQEAQRVQTRWTQTGPYQGTS